ncbi:hypothetical protein EVAR_102550_1 [Eumeta japonica]|uniref:Uncharacterized protein n=1 Tax=Eumeta variegata TaxID=151549 RepID=A0A4C2A8M6_EUMVA|nr:hypothetical protein EVAR_102550_1 [Eumeta japonica]
MREGSLPDRPLPSRERTSLLPQSRATSPPMPAAARKDSLITWFCYAPVTENQQSLIRGLPVDTAPDAIITALQELGFPAEYAADTSP